MNRVGRLGRGESVWLGFFLHSILGRFIPLCEARGDGDRAQRYRAYRERLGATLNEAGWDGAWYRRAYYDDGTPLGSADNDECRIDALAQAWAVISGVAPPERDRAVPRCARSPSGCRDGPADPAADAAVRSHRARSRLHQGLRAGGARERRPVHPRGALGGAGAGRGGPDRARRDACSRCSHRSATRAPRKRSRPTRSSRT